LEAPGSGQILYAKIFEAIEDSEKHFRRCQCVAAGTMAIEDGN
jgi:hypothetical protein